MIVAAVLLFCSAALLAVTAVSLADDDDVDAEPGGSCPTVPTATVTGSTTTISADSTTTSSSTSHAHIRVNYIIVRRDDYDAVVAALDHLASSPTNTSPVSPSPARRLVDNVTANDRPATGHVDVTAGSRPAAGDDDHPPNR